jgi:hypothetical protein
VRKGFDGAIMLAAVLNTHRAMRPEEHKGKLVMQHKQQRPRSKGNSLIPVERIERAILLIHGQKVILDKDLAILYQVSTGNLNKAVNRNLDRFPEDFMFQLTREEFNNLMFHSGTSSWGGTRKLPRAFTEQGVAMLSSVLRSKRAVSVNIEIMRAFVRLRQMLASNATLERRLKELEKKYDAQFKVVFDAIRQLMAPPEKVPKKIGFRLREKHPAYFRKR